MADETRPIEMLQPMTAPVPVAAHLLSLVYDELRALAGSYLHSDPSHTLQPTALVHEAYLKLVKGDGAAIDRNHFIAIAATAMRQVLVDHARRKQADKRGGTGRKANRRIEMIAAPPDSGSSRDLRVLELDELLTKLAVADARASRVAELRLFGGMEQQQIAEVLDVSRTTVVNDWTFAKAWLVSESGEGDE